MVKHHYEYINHCLYLFPRAFNKLVCASPDGLTNRNHASRNDCDVSNADVFWSAGHR
jgi:hypothetical protein